MLSEERLRELYAQGMITESELECRLNPKTGDNIITVVLGCFDTEGRGALLREKHESVDGCGVRKHD